MDSRRIKHAIETGQFRTFAGTRITIPTNKPLPLDEFMRTVRQLVADQKRITPADLSQVVAIAEHTPAGFSLGFGLVPSSQADIDKPNGVPIDEHAVRKLEIQLAIATKVAGNAIDGGNALALNAEESVLYAEQVKARLTRSSDETISRFVAKRARGNLSLFELSSATKKLGGNHNVPTQFPSQDNLTLRACRILHWPTRNQAVVASAGIASIPALMPFVRQKTLKLWVLPDSPEAYLLRCADLAGIAVDLDINLVEKLSPRKTVPYVTKVQGKSAIIAETRARIDTLDE